jgi:GNAT superfamily N-acetyltransferase
MDVPRNFAFRPAQIQDSVRIEMWMRHFYAEERLTIHPGVVAAMRNLIGSPELGRLMIIQIQGIDAGYFVLTFGYSLERAGRTALLDELFIEPHLRGQGAGKAALQAAIGIAGQAGCNFLQLELDPHNPRAGHIYRQAGFVASPRGHLTLALDPMPRSPDL